MPSSRRRRSALVPASAALLGACALAALWWARPALPQPPPAPPGSAGVPSVAAPVAAAATTASPPVLVRIPRIGVRAEVMRLGLDPDGTLEVPPLTKADLAGWYEQGPPPGAKGPTVIVGHVDTAKGPAVFYRLGDLRPGDQVHVTREDGKVATFRLDSVESVHKDRFPTRRVYGGLPYAAIRLISCGGAFDPATGHYTDNVIAYGHLTAVA